MADALLATTGYGFDISGSDLSPFVAIYSGYRVGTWTIGGVLYAAVFNFSRDTTAGSPTAFGSLAVNKSTDGGVTWAEYGTVMDGSLIDTPLPPFGGTPPSALWKVAAAKQSYGNLLYFLCDFAENYPPYEDSDYFVVTFDVSTGTVALLPNPFPTFGSPGESPVNTDAMDISVKSDGTVSILYTGDFASAGPDVGFRVYVIEYQAGTWGAFALVPGQTGLSVDFYPAQLIVGASDLLHIILDGKGNNDPGGLWHVSLDTSGTFGTPQNPVVGTAHENASPVFAPFKRETGIGDCASGLLVVPYTVVSQVWAITGDDSANPTFTVTLVEDTTFVSSIAYRCGLNCTIVAPSTSLTVNAAPETTTSAAVTGSGSAAMFYTKAAIDQSDPGPADRHIITWIRQCSFTGSWGTPSNFRTYDMSTQNLAANAVWAIASNLCIIGTVDRVANATTPTDAVNYRHIYPGSAPPVAGGAGPPRYHKNRYVWG